mmetsp:Transcript_22195/g.51380  ORF Transcript_22195/g.51380 Transcript_22195/m.51380 type:complete len:89 (+) Transcript_22195:344-610(+)
MRLCRQYMQALQQGEKSQWLVQTKEHDIQALRVQMQSLSNSISESLESLEEAHKISVYDGTTTATYWGDPNLRGRQGRVQQYLRRRGS